MSDIKDERRRHKRYIISGVQGTLFYPTELNVIGISIEGASVETTNRLELNKEYTLKTGYH